MLKRVKDIIRCLIPFAVRRRLLNPIIVPKGYQEEVFLAESILVLRHEKKGLDDEYWASAVRKYAHIIDKGLQRCDCEPGHSETFYQHARDCLGMINGAEMLSDPSIIWAKEKIASYERLQNSSTTCDRATPFDETRCTYEDLVDVIKTRRSIRGFSDRQIPREVIEKIVDVVNWAPSSCNRQTTRVFIADSKEMILNCLDANNGATCFGGEISCFMAFCADLRAYDMPTEMTLPILDVSLGMQNCCLVAHSLDVGLTLLNWTHHSKEQDRRLREALSIPPHYRIVANAVLGYPEQGAPLPARKGPTSTYSFR